MQRRLPDTLTKLFLLLTACGLMAGTFVTGNRRAWCDRPIAVAWSPDGSKLAVGYPFQGVRVWDLSDEHLRASSLRMSAHEFYQCPRGCMQFVDAQTLIVPVDRRRESPELVLYDVRTGEAERSIELALPCDALAISADGRMLARVAEPAAPDKTSVQLTDLTTGRQVTVVSGLSRIHSLSLCRDGRRLVAVGTPPGEWNPEMEVWDVASQTRLPPRSELPVYGEAKLSLDGQKVLAAESTAPRVYDVASGQELGELPPCSDDLHLSPDGNCVLAVLNTGLMVWDVPTGKILRETRLPTGNAPPKPHVAELSQDFTELAVAQGDEVCVFDVATLRVSRVFGVGSRWPAVAVWSILLLGWGVVWAWVTERGQRAQVASKGHLLPGSWGLPAVSLVFGALLVGGIYLQFILAAPPLFGLRVPLAAVLYASGFSLLAKAGMVLALIGFTFSVQRIWRIHVCPISPAISS